MTAIIDFNAEAEINKIEHEYATDFCICGKKKSIYSKHCKECAGRLRRGTKYERNPPAYRLPMVSDPNYKLVKRDKSIYLSHQIVRLYGCMSCDWKGTPLCRYGFKKGPSNPMKKNMHTNGICLDRKEYLASFHSKTGGRSYEEWQTRYNRHNAQIVNENDRQKLDEYQKLIDQKEEEGMPEKELEILRARKQLAHDNYVEMWEKLQKSYDKKLDREVMAKVNKETRLSLMDIQSIIRNEKPKEEVIDAEFEDEESITEPKLEEERVYPEADEEEKVNEEEDDIDNDDLELMGVTKEQYEEEK